MSVGARCQVDAYDLLVIAGKETLLSEGRMAPDNGALSGSVGGLEDFKASLFKISLPR